MKYSENCYNICSGARRQKSSYQAGKIKAIGNDFDMTISLASYVCGVSHQPLRYQTIGDALSEAATRWGRNDAVVSVHQNLRLTYAQLNEQAEKLALAFLTMGLAPGDRIGIWAPNCIEWTLTQFASAKAGLILVNINPAYRLAELEFALNTVGCKALVLMEKFKTSDYVGMIKTLAPEIQNCMPGKLISKKLPKLENLVVIGQADSKGFIEFEKLKHYGSEKDKKKLHEIQKHLSPDDPINIQFTSGTTGSPKGATLSHFNILNNGYFVGEAIKLTPKDRVSIPVPLYHCFGMVMGNLGCITHGATMIYPDFGFDPQATLKAIEEEKCTALYGVPTMFVAELACAQFSDFNLESLRTGIMAGALCPEDIMTKVINKMYMSQVTIAYGMTETSPVSFQSAIDDNFQKRTTTIGRVHPHVQVKIVNEQGRIVPCGQQGELLTRGYSVMKGYWGDEDKTAESIDQNGWMHTGDLAVIDDEGFGLITGRIKDMIIRGGENIYPKEIEDFVRKHPNVRDVSIFGVPDQKYGEQVCAWVQLNADSSLNEDEIREHCHGQLAHYKVPKYVKFVDEFPMTVTGKIQKFIMRKQMVELCTQK